MKKIINVILSIIGVLFLVATIQLITKKNYGASFVGMIFTIGIMYFPIKCYFSKEAIEQKKLDSLNRKLEKLNKREKLKQEINEKENTLKLKKKNSTENDKISVASQTQYKDDNFEEQNWIKKNRFFYINEKEQKVRINTREYNFKDILSFELLTDDSSVLKTSTGSALTRSLLFGGIIGGTTSKKKSINYCTQLQIKITVNNLSNPTEYINFMIGFNKLKKGSIFYKKASEEANECLSLLTIITNYNK